MGEAVAARPIRAVRAGVAFGVVDTFLVRAADDAVGHDHGASLMLAKVRPISCNDSPTFQRRHMSIRCSAESLSRFPCAINTTFRKNDSYQMVLHRPVEPAVFSGKFGLVAPADLKLSESPCSRNYRQVASL